MKIKSTPEFQEKGRTKPPKEKKHDLGKTKPTKPKKETKKSK